MINGQKTFFLISIALLILSIFAVYIRFNVFNDYIIFTDEEELPETIGDLASSVFNNGL